jgi:hypothetical protein
MKWVGHIVSLREKGNACKISAKRPEEKRPLGRPRYMWLDNIKIDFI